MAEMFVGTIHAFCLELLKSEAPKYLTDFSEILNSACAPTNAANTLA
jgi:hypothetical protein